MEAPTGSHWCCLARRKECSRPSCLESLAGEESLWPMRGEKYAFWAGLCIIARSSAEATWLPCIFRWGKWNQWGWRSSLYCCLLWQDSSCHCPLAAQPLWVGVGCAQAYEEGQHCPWLVLLVSKAPDEFFCLSCQSCLVSPTELLFHPGEE